MVYAGDFLLADQNCIAVILCIFVVVFMFITLVSRSHWPTFLFALALVFVGATLALYFLHPKAMLRQEPQRV